MTFSFPAKRSAKSTPIIAVETQSFDNWLKKKDNFTKNFLRDAGFTAKNGAFVQIPAKNGQTAEVVVCYGGPQASLYALADLPAKLPKNPAGYYLASRHDSAEQTQMALGWALGSYAFRRYKKGKPPEFAKLVMPAGADRKYVEIAARSAFMARDLINTPARDLGPADLSTAARTVAKAHKASFSAIVGKDLLRKNYPMVYAVGMAATADRAPRLIDIRWGNKKHRKVTLVGKGVCFDTGGLNIKTENYMLLMKKDMGGAACVLALANMIMAHKLPVCLRVLIPAVENAIGANAFRPGDIIPTRKGLTVEIGNTDAEGRLILADALAEAASEKPDLIVDFATLTGAARAALGPDIPNLFCNDDKIADRVLSASRAQQDPLWRMPLWQPYAEQLNSKIADTNNIGGNLGGHITAALFLQKFVGDACGWVHLDTNAYNNTGKPGRPEGGEAMGVRALFDVVAKTALK